MERRKPTCTHPQFLRALTSTFQLPFSRHSTRMFHPRDVAWWNIPGRKDWRLNPLLVLFTCENLVGCHRLGCLYLYRAPQLQLKYQGSFFTFLPFHLLLNVNRHCQRDHCYSRDPVALSTFSANSCYSRCLCLSPSKSCCPSNSAKIAHFAPWWREADEMPSSHWMLSLGNTCLSLLMPSPLIIELAFSLCWNPFFHCQNHFHSRAENLQVDF